STVHRYHFATPGRRSGMSSGRPYSRLVSLADIVAGDTTESSAPLAGPCRLEVPIYQRPYVWQTDQVRQLCTDLRNAWHDRRAIYYIGAVMLVKGERKKDDSFVSYELVDGQQRMTT